MTMSRRQLFGLLLRRPELDPEGRSESGPLHLGDEPTPALAPKPPERPPSTFALDSFYDARVLAKRESRDGTSEVVGVRTPVREIPRFAIRESISTPTTRVGLGPLPSARSDRQPTPHEARAIPASLVPSVLIEACLATTTFCSVCTERCPVPGAIAIRDRRPHIVVDRCDGCGVCVQVCPAPILALELVARRPAEVDP